MAGEDSKAKGSLERGQGPAHGGLLGHTKELRSYPNSRRELQEHDRARFTLYQAPLHSLCVKGDCEYDETADKGW